MTSKLRNYIREFKEERGRVSTNGHRQAKELQSIQQAIKAVAEDEWQKLSDKEKEEVSDIINITDEWWCND